MNNSSQFVLFLCRAFWMVCSLIKLNGFGLVPMASFPCRHPSFKTLFVLSPCWALLIMLPGCQFIINCYAVVSFDCVLTQILGLDLLFQITWVLLLRLWPLCPEYLSALWARFGLAGFCLVGNESFIEDFIHVCFELLHLKGGLAVRVHLQGAFRLFYHNHEFTIWTCNYICWRLWCFLFFHLL